MNRFRFLAAAGFVLSLAFWFVGEAAASESPLVLKAKSRQAESEKALAAFRAERLKLRGELSAKIKAAYDRVNSLQAKLADAKEKHASVIRRREELIEAQAATERTILNLIYQMGKLAGSPLPEDISGDDVVRQVWSRIEKRLDDLRFACEIRLGREDVVSRCGVCESTPVLRIGHVAAYAIGETSDTQGELLLSGGELLRISGPYLSDENLALLQNIKSSLQTKVLPLDPSGKMISRKSAVKRNWREWLASGGLFIYPIVLVGIAGLLLMFERGIYLAYSSLPASGLEKLRGAVKRLDAGSVSSARTAEGRLAAAGIACAGDDADGREAAMEAALLGEAPRLNRSLSFLGALAGVAPLLGLLGTVSGMIKTFSDLSSVGAASAQILSGGISEALITTQLGLMVAVPLLLGYSWLNRSAERRSLRLEQWAMEILQIHPDKEKGDKDA